MNQYYKLGAICVSQCVAVEPVEFWLVYGWKIALSRKSLILLQYIDLQYRKIFKIKKYNCQFKPLGKHSNSLFHLYFQTHFHTGISTSALIIPCLSLAYHFELWELR